MKRTALALLLTSLWAANAHAEKIALLVGVGDYADPSMPDLDGPAHDLKAMRELLVKRWSFKPDNIRVLQDNQATQAAIVAELGKLKARSAAGDSLFLYFTGHGTSARDSSNELPLPSSSGAFVPYDFRIKSGRYSETDLRRSLLVGRWHLRPVLQELEKDREIFVVMDSCYSGNAVRSLDGRPRFKTRQIPISLEGDTVAAPAAGERKTERGEAYPYKRVVFIAAASDAEKAEDIGFADADRTFDGNPHGAFTDAFIRVMNGSAPADANNDKALDYVEVQQAVRDLLQKGEHRHTPQLLPVLAEDSGRLTQKAVFDQPRVDFAAPPPWESMVKVALGTGVGGTVFSRLKGISVTGGRVDLRVERDPAARDAYRLLGAAGDVIVSGASEADIASRLRAEVWLRQWLKPLKPRFGLRLETDPAVKGNNFVEGDTLIFQARPARESYLVLLNLDAKGQLTVLYPQSAAETRPLAANATAAIPGSDPRSRIRVQAPFGTDTVVAVAFPEKPDWEVLKEIQGVAVDHVAVRALESMTARQEGAAWSQLPLRTFPRNNRP